MSRLLAAVDRLSPRQRRAVLDRLRPVGRPAKVTYRKPDPAALKRFLAMAGTGKSRYRDVSSNKYKHLGEIYASHP